MPRSKSHSSARLPGALRLQRRLNESPAASRRHELTARAQVFDGLAYLNTAHTVRDTGGNAPGHATIIHYDLKPANILFDELGVVKISDFGLSKLLSVDSGSASVELTSPGAGTLFYQPPECQMAGPGGAAPHISSKVDVWAAGACPNLWLAPCASGAFHAVRAQRRCWPGPVKSTREQACCSRRV